MTDSNEITGIIADAILSEDHSDVMAEDKALTAVKRLEALGYRIVPKTPEYQSRYVTLKLTHYKEDVPKVHIQSVAGLEGLLLGGSYNNVVVWNDLGPAIRHLLQANHDWPVKESTDE